MGGLFSSLIATSAALRTYDKSLSVIQNNVTNVNTPGFAKQRLQLLPKNFSTKFELSGGVLPGELLSSRDSYIERGVWRQNSQFGRQAQASVDLGQVEPLFQIGGDTGIAGSMNRFFSAVSSWTVNPNDPVARQVVLDRASHLARTVNGVANSLGEAAANADRELREGVDAVNTLTSELAQLNQERRTDRRKLQDPALDARIHSTLEQLSEYVDFNAVEQEDGSFTVFLGGQTPLVQGDRQLELNVDFSNPEPAILDENGTDLTGQINQGKLKGVLETRNERLPYYTEQLNRLAQTFADNVNGVLAGGLDAGGSPPSQNLFDYDTQVGAAFTLKVNPLAPSDLAAASAGAPGGNGNAIALSELQGTDTIDDVTFSEFYGRLASKVGRDLRESKDSADLEEQLVNQMRTLREETSSVSLDEEAARLVETQRAYQANAQLFQVLNSLTDTVMELLR